MVIAPAMKRITENIISSYDTSVAEVGRVKKEANEMLAAFGASHKKMGAQLRRDLAEDKTEMKSGVRAMRNGFQTSHEEMGQALQKDLAGHNQTVKGEVAEMRQKIRASHHNMSTQLKKELAQARVDMKSDVEKMRSDFHRAQADVRSDLKKAAVIWQEVAGILQAKRARIGSSAGVSTTVAREKIPAPEAKLLVAINKHPKGITLAEVAESLGVVPVVLGRAARSLLEKGKVRKEDKLYYPVRAE